MSYLEFFKTQWNIILGAVISILVLLTGVVVEPTISLSFIEGGMEPAKVCRFCVFAFLLLMLIPFSKFRSRKFIWRWWCGAVILLMISILLFFSYNNFCNENMVFVSASRQRMVIGKTLHPYMRKHVDSLQKAEERVYTNADLLTSVADSPQELWPESQIRSASVMIVKFYLILMLSLSLFLMVAIQALYCSAQVKKVSKPSADL